MQGSRSSTQLMGTQGDAGASGDGQGLALWSIPVPHVGAGLGPSSPLLS